MYQSKINSITVNIFKYNDNMIKPFDYNNYYNLNYNIILVQTTVNKYLQNSNGN